MIKIKKNERGFTLLEVIILMAISIILIIPGYSQISSISRVRIEASHRRKVANRYYELVERVKRLSIEELLEGVEKEDGDVGITAWAEYDREFEEAREAKKRNGGVKLPHRKVNVYVEIYEGENLVEKYNLTKVEEGNSIEY